MVYYCLNHKTSTHQGTNEKSNSGFASRRQLEAIASLVADLRRCAVALRARLVIWHRTGNDASSIHNVWTCPLSSFSTWLKASFNRFQQHQHQSWYISLLNVMGELLNPYHSVACEATNFGWASGDCPTPRCPLVTRYGPVRSSASTAIRSSLKHHLVGGLEHFLFSH